MKKDRNCGANMYPTYPMNNQQMMAPNMMPQMMAPNMIPQMMPQYNTQQTYISGSLEQQVNNLANQVNNLERRVSSLEGLVGNTNYNTSNFQMM